MLNEKIYKAYPRPMVRCVAMLIRWMHLKVEGKTDHYGAFKIKATSVQMTAAQQLYILFLKTHGSPDLSKLEELGQNLFASLLRADSLGTAQIACPIDQTFFLMSILPKERFRSGTFIAATCAAIDYFLWAIFVHTTRLKAAGCTANIPPPEFPLEKSGNADTLEDVEAPESDGDEDIAIEQEKLLEEMEVEDEGGDDTSDDGSNSEEVMMDETSSNTFIEQAKCSLELLLNGMSSQI